MCKAKGLIETDRRAYLLGMPRDVHDGVRDGVYVREVEVEGDVTTGMRHLYSNDFSVAATLAAPLCGPP